MSKTLKTAALALLTPAVLATSAAPAMARDHHRYDRYERYEHRGDGYRYDNYGRYDNRGYNDYGRYGEPVYSNTRVWRGNDGRYYCRRSNGTTGLIIGGAAGALIGREVAGYRGDRTLGAILGAGVGALLGREVDRGGSRCR